MENLVVTVLLPGALAIVMFGLGLGLQIDDFKRVVLVPKAAVIALVLQALVLPAICFGVVVVFQLPGELAVGMMLLAASPGGTMANIFSHFSGGDVALNVSLTAVNCVTSIVTLPIVVNLSIAHFLADGERIGLHVEEIARVALIVLVPVLIGMIVRRTRPAVAASLSSPLRTASAIILAAVILLALIGNFDILRDNFVTVGSASLVFCCVSLLVGYWFPRIAGVERSQAISSAFEVGIHNASVAVLIALSVLDNEQMSVPSGVYGVVMYLPAMIAYYIFRDSAKKRRPTAAAPIA